MIQPNTIFPLPLLMLLILNYFIHAHARLPIVTTFEPNKPHSVYYPYIFKHFQCRQITRRATYPTSRLGLHLARLPNPRDTVKDF
jgi:hypothetical protein